MTNSLFGTDAQIIISNISCLNFSEILGIRLTFSDYDVMFSLGLGCLGSPAKRPGGHRALISRRVNFRIARSWSNYEAVGRAALAWWRFPRRSTRLDEKLQLAKSAPVSEADIKISVRNWKIETNLINYSPKQNSKVDSLFAIRASQNTQVLNSPSNNRL